MTTRESLANAIANHEDIFARINALAQRTDDARRVELLELRRQLSTQLGILGAFGDELREIADDQDVVREYRARLSAMRNAVALHQAKWPVIAINEDAQGYRESTRRVIETSHAFLSWTKTTILQN